MAFGARKGGYAAAGKRSRTYKRAMRAVVGATVTAALGAGLLAGPAHAQTIGGYRPPPVPRTPSIPVSAIASDYRTPAPIPAWKTAAPAWPSGSGDAVLASGQAGAATARTAASGSGVARSNLPTKLIERRWYEHESVMNKHLPPS